MSTMIEPAHLSPEAVASLPPPGSAGPSQPVFAPDSSRYLAFVSIQSKASTKSSPSPHQSNALYAPLTTSSSKGLFGNGGGTAGPKPFVAPTSSERVLMCLDLEEAQGAPTPPYKPLLRWNALTRHSSKRRMTDVETAPSSNSSAASANDSMSLEEKLRRERQRVSSGSSSLTQFSWAWMNQSDTRWLRLLIPARGCLYIQDGVHQQQSHNQHARCLHDKSMTGIPAAGPAIDPQLSPDGTMVAWTCQGELFLKGAHWSADQPAIQLTFGAVQNEEECISHGVADFVAQEEMDRYRGFWWHPDSTGILFCRTDESNVPLYRIMHQDGSDAFIDVAKRSQNPSGTTPISPSSSSNGLAYEDHRYPFAGKQNALVKLGFILIDRDSFVSESHGMESREDDAMMHDISPQEMASYKWESCVWIDPPREAPEYLARINWLPDGSVSAQWQNRAQNVSVLQRIDLSVGKGRTLVLERSDVWINLHHMFKSLPRPIHPSECLGGGLEPDIPPLPYPLPSGSFSFLFASERSGYSHLHLYTYVPGINGDQAIFIKALTSGEWMVEQIIGVDMTKDVIYCTGTLDSPLERHLYAIPFLNTRLSSEDGRSYEQCSISGDFDPLCAAPNGVRRGLSKVMHALKGGRSSSSEVGSSSLVKPIRMTEESGMHNIVMDDNCRFFVDSSSDLSRPSSVKIYEIPQNETPIFVRSEAKESGRLAIRLVMVLYDAMRDDKNLGTIIGTSAPSERLAKALPAPEFISFPTSDGAETLHAALYRPDHKRHGPGPYPLVCAVYGGPHVQRVNRSWSQSADLRAQRLRSLGFCVVKCDNRGSSRRGTAFESAIAGRFGRLEVLDQVAVVRQLVARGIADGSRVGVYGWSYGGYLAAMCLCRAPDVFHVAVAGAPVTSWDGYDTHYTERYMGTPTDNPSGYRESAVFDHVPNMRGKLMLVHGLIDENVHFRHTARLINKLIAAGKEYDLLIFPEERHSPRRLRDRVYMEQRISDYFVRHLATNTSPSALDILTSMGPAGLRTMAGHL
ncbi:dipeptidyl-peptidase 4 [Fistulifera solaris]|uniref:Dipeptidyl-peptidase 4 n=1 Tax=Fistulifera solaris TaxID=1519565 RepID=A0A1Z5JFR0_FISSO|nr:dipeptidyl-peptidase 4 [Fistulifera solaris]|eukprot:GAX12732.1 dipeptidyl-peptidase 4 [Fistulifera solaris]